MVRWSTDGPESLGWASCGQRWSPRQPGVWAGLSGGSELSEFSVGEGFPPPAPATPCRLQH